MTKILKGKAARRGIKKWCKLAKGGSTSSKQFAKATRVLEKGVGLTTLGRLARSLPVDLNLAA